RVAPDKRSAAGGSNSARIQLPPPSWTPTPTDFGGSGDNKALIDRRHLNGSNRNFTNYNNNNDKHNSSESPTSTSTETESTSRRGAALNSTTTTSDDVESSTSRRSSSRCCGSGRRAFDLYAGMFWQGSPAAWHWPCPAPLCCFGELHRVRARIKLSCCSPAELSAGLGGALLGRFLWPSSPHPGCWARPAGRACIGSLLVLMLCDKIWSLMPAFAVQGFGFAALPKRCISRASSITTRLADCLAPVSGPARSWHAAGASDRSRLRAAESAAASCPANVTLLRQHKDLRMLTGLDSRSRSSRQQSASAGLSNAAAALQFSAAELPSVASAQLKPLVAAPQVFGCSSSLQLPFPQSSLQQSSAVAAHLCSHRAVPRRSRKKPGMSTDSQQLNQSPQRKQTAACLGTK
uniref:Ashwin n=1 Tax=Macrostomum lignano TaxID=282301 RepID=A0A1I8FIT6_9PLAT